MMTAQNPRGLRFFALILLTALVTGCSDPADSPESYEDTVILISIDGFGHDYLEWHEAPVLNALAEEGVFADEGMTPAFPTTTFPNHYSIVTGLYPENHGIVSNTMVDREMGERFSIRDRDAVTDPRWWGGEPIWNTARKHGVRSATYFWVGSEAEVDGVQPNYWFPYDGSVPGAERVDQALAWLDLPEGERPGFVSLYFSKVDSEGHRHGTRSPEVQEAILQVDAYLGRLLDGLTERGIREHVNIIIVSDHGMADRADDRVIFLDDYIDLDDVEATDVSALLGLNPVDGAHDRVLRALQNAHPALDVYEKADVPERLHYSNHPRIPDIIGIADVGWVVRRERSEFDPERFGGATHGWDNLAGEMASLFIATGPAFRKKATTPPFESIHLYALMAHIMDIPPADTDGSLDEVDHVLTGGSDY